MHYAVAQGSDGLAEDRRAGHRCGGQHDCDGKRGIAQGLLQGKRYGGEYAGDDYDLLFAQSDHR
jgi:hypothetical protein